jgi:hypothetical protein
MAQQIRLAFGVEIDKDVVGRILSVPYQPESEGGPAWLTFIGTQEGQLVELRSVPL